MAKLCFPPLFQELTHLFKLYSWHVEVPWSLAHAESFLQQCVTRKISGLNQLHLTCIFFYFFLCTSNCAGIAADPELPTQKAVQRNVQHQTNN